MAKLAKLRTDTRYSYENVYGSKDSVLSSDKDLF